MNIILKNGDCVEVLATLSESSIGSVICDPPYGLSFMGKDFDKLGNGESQQLWHRDWLNEAHRVLQQNGIIKAFSGTRTYHRLAAAMEQAGFVDISLEAWCYGSGFPKSMDISKQLDKKAGVEPKVVGFKKVTRLLPNDVPFGQGLISETPVVGGTVDVTEPVSEEAQQWNGWGTALKPAWEPVVVGRKP